MSVRTARSKIGCSLLTRRRPGRRWNPVRPLPPGSPHIRPGGRKWGARHFPDRAHRTPPAPGHPVSNKGHNRASTAAVRGHFPGECGASQWGRPVCGHMTHQMSSGSGIESREERKRMCDAIGSRGWLIQNRSANGKAARNLNMYGSIKLIHKRQTNKIAF